MKLRNSLVAGAVLALSAVFGATGALAAPNIVQDPSFEDGLGYWTGQNMAQGVFFGGHTDAATNCIGSACVTTPTAYLGQDLNTTAGQTYDLTFEVYNSAVNSDLPQAQQFNIFWNGSSLGVTNYDVAGQWTYFTYDNLLATSNLTNLTFAGRNDPGVIGFDDFSVVQSSAGAPEPATWAMMLVGFLGLGAALRARKPSPALHATMR